MSVVVFRDTLDESSFFKSLVLSHFLKADYSSHASFSLHSLRLNVDLNLIIFKSIYKEVFVSEAILREAFLEGTNVIFAD
jgi:hypothetical protein